LCADPRFYEFIEITLDWDTPGGCAFRLIEDCDPSGTYVFDAGDCSGTDGFERLCTDGFGVLDLSFDVSTGLISLLYNYDPSVGAIFSIFIDCRNEDSVLATAEIQDLTFGGCSGTRTLTITARLIRIDRKSVV
jgi:hypothetical protein